MYSLTPESTGKQILRYLETFTKTDVVALCSYLNNQSEYSVPTYGSKDQLLMGLRGIDREVLFSAIEVLFNPCGAEDEDDEDDWEDDEDADEEDEEGEEADEEGDEEE